MVKSGKKLRYFVAIVIHPTNSHESFLIPNTLRLWNAFPASYIRFACYVLSGSLQEVFTGRYAYSNLIIR